MPETGRVIGTLELRKFMSARNLLNVLDQITVLGIMAVGMTLVILIGGIDLAVGSALALAGFSFGAFVTSHAADQLS